MTQESFDRFSGIGGETSFGRGSLRLCQICGDRPEWYPEEGGVPICKSCDEYIVSLPHDEKQAEMKRQWDIYRGKEI